jgi:hypothetical protein
MAWYAVSGVSAGISKRLSQRHVSIGGPYTDAAQASAAHPARTVVHAASRDDALRLVCRSAGVTLRPT